jgi:hypothetical protein
MATAIRDTSPGKCIIPSAIFGKHINVTQSSPAENDSNNTDNKKHLHEWYSVNLLIILALAVALMQVYSDLNRKIMS